MQPRLRELSLVNKGFVVSLFLLAFGFGMWVIFTVLPQQNRPEAIEGVEVVEATKGPLEYELMFHDDENITCIVAIQDGTILALSCLR